MFQKRNANVTTLAVNQAVEGETIEAKVRRITEQKDPITDGAPQIFTERQDGVHPEHNVRTDRWELAVEAMDKVSQDKLAKREARAKTAKAEGEGSGKGKESPKDGGGDKGGGTPKGTDTPPAGPTTKD